MQTLPSISYPTDLTDREWALLEPLRPPAKRRSIDGGSGCVGLGYTKS